jgi:hypothetical protein
MEELKKLATLLEREGIDAAIVAANGTMPGKSDFSKRGIILTFPRHVPDLEERQDVLFYSPPPSIGHFTLPFYRTVRRIHFLFNHHHLEYEERLQSIMELTPEKLNTIMRAMRRLSGRGFSAGDPEKIVKDINHDRIKKITVELACRLLKELSLLEENPEGEQRLRALELKNEDIEASKLFRSMKEERHHFARFMLLYRRSFEELKEEIQAAISGAPAVSPGSPAGLEALSLKSL